MKGWLHDLQIFLPNDVLTSLLQGGLNQIQTDTGFIFSQYYVGEQHTDENINILIIILTSWRFCSDKLLYLDFSVRR